MLRRATLRPRRFPPAFPKSGLDPEFFSLSLRHVHLTLFQLPGTRWPSGLSLDQLEGKERDGNWCLAAEGGVRGLRLPIGVEECRKKTYDLVSPRTYLHGLAIRR